jgi:hypothetical protein
MIAPLIGIRELTILLLNTTGTVTLANVTVHMYIEVEGFGGKYAEILGNWTTNMS